MLDELRSMTRRLPLVVMLAVPLGACSPDMDPGAAAELPVLALSEPVLRIGVLDGDPAYTFGSIEDVVRLADGSLAVSDGQNNRISVFDDEGVLIRAWGTRGDGPGEFRSLSRLYPGAADTVYAADLRTGRVSAFDGAGAFGRQVEGVALSGDTLFSLDSWLYARFWVDGALGPQDRASVRAALDRLPPPRLSPGYRSVRVAEDGRLWIREPDTDADVVTWLLTDRSGSPTAWIDAPSAFAPKYIGPDGVRGNVLGVWTGESGVDFVRAYDVVETEARRPVPSWLAEADGARGNDAGADPEAPPPDDTEMMTLIRDAIRQMATAQEIHYADAYTYTTELDSLELDLPEGLDVTFPHADRRGWSAVFAHARLDRICGLAFGSGAPPGWNGGEILCAPSPSTPAVPR